MLTLLECSLATMCAKSLVCFHGSCHQEPHWFQPCKNKFSSKSWLSYRDDVIFNELSSRKRLKERSPERRLSLPNSASSTLLVDQNLFQRPTLAFGKAVSIILKYFTIVWILNDEKTYWLIFFILAMLKH